MSDKYDEVAHRIVSHMEGDHAIDAEIVPILRERFPEPTESALAAKDARELAGKIVRDYHKPDMYKMDRDAIAAEIERFVEAANKALQPPEFYKDYDEGTMRAMQALLGKAETNLHMAKLEITARKQECQTVTRKRDAAEAEVKALRVCGNCEHGKSTSLDDTRCYQNTPYLPTGRHCAGCPDWKRAAIVANPRAALQGGK